MENSVTTNRISRKDGKLVYSEENAIIECDCATPHSGDPRIIGKEYSYTKKCVDCNGRGHNPGLRAGKKIKKTCKTCEGRGYICLDEPIIHGVCKKCNGELKHSNVSYCDFATTEDKEMLFSLIDFENTIFNSNSTFNEGYVGFGLVGGVTDYGRYTKMTPVEFHEEVKKHVVDGSSQYAGFLNKEKVLCNSIKINKTRSGWFLYPIW
jgi:hypothetical protein